MTAFRNTVQLVVEKGDRSGAMFPLPESGTLRIGRDPDCELRLDVLGVSRVHATIEATDQGWTVRDQGSLNGVVVNGARVDAHALRDGDRITLGSDAVLVFQCSPDDPWIGKTCDGYRIETLIGKGGMGRVYRATQVSMERTVALKILSRKLSDKRDLVESFVREARAAAKLDHPHVVKIHDVGEEDGTYFIAMEYLERGTLGSLIERLDRLPPKRVVTMMIDAARALVWAEEHGIVHRDIKPGNLLLDGRYRVKVADFGIATELRGDGSPGERRRKTRAAGSPHFMAPEQVGVGSVDHRADIYALGATAYMALSGAPPFSGSDARTIVRRKLAEDPVPLDDVVPDLPPGLSAIVQKLLARSPEDRYQSAQDVVAVLTAIQRRLVRKPVPAVTSRAAAPPPPAVDREAAKAGASASPDRPARRRAGRSAGKRRPASSSPSGAPVFIVAGVIVVLGVGFWLLRPDGPSRPTEISAGTLPAGGGERTNSALPERRSPPRETRPSPLPSFAPEPPADRDALAALAQEVELALLESRFERASDLVDDAAELADPDGVRERLRARVTAAERLFEARRRALALERGGDLDGAARVLHALQGELPRPFDEELDAALRALESRSAAGAAGS